MKKLKELKHSVLDITEKVWQKQVEQLAKTFGWACYHTFLSRWSDAGFPDLVLVRERVIFAELKRENNKLTASQERWKELLLGANAEYYLWRPSDFEKIAEILKRRLK